MLNLWDKNIKQRRKSYERGLRESFAFNRKLKKSSWTRVKINGKVLGFFLEQHRKPVKTMKHCRHGRFWELPKGYIFKSVADHSCPPQILTLSLLGHCYRNQPIHSFWTSFLGGGRCVCSPKPSPSQSCTDGWLQLQPLTDCKPAGTLPRSVYPACELGQLHLAPGFVHCVPGLWPKCDGPNGSY